MYEPSHIRPLKQSPPTPISPPRPRPHHYQNVGSSSNDNNNNNNNNNINNNNNNNNNVGILRSHFPFITLQPLKKTQRYNTYSQPTSQSIQTITTLVDGLSADCQTAHRPTCSQAASAPPPRDIDTRVLASLSFLEAKASMNSRILSFSPFLNRVLKFRISVSLIPLQGQVLQPISWGRE